MVIVSDRAAHEAIDDFASCAIATSRDDAPIALVCRTLGKLCCVARILCFYPIDLANTSRSGQTPFDVLMKRGGTVFCLTASSTGINNDKRFHRGSLQCSLPCSSVSKACADQ